MVGPQKHFSKIAYTNNHYFKKASESSCGIVALPKKH